MFPRKKNSISLLTLFWFVIVFFGVSSAQGGEKITIKIPKVEKNVREKSGSNVSKDVNDKNKRSVEKDDNEKVDYIYDPANKIDPFKSFISIKEELEGETEEEPRTYLETLDISQLTVSAIVLSGKENWALIRDSKGDGHIIKIGIPIGKSRGKVIRISKNEVVVREYYKDIKGKKIIRDVSMKLPSIDKIKKQ